LIILLYKLVWYLLLLFSNNILIVFQKLGSFFLGGSLA